MRSPACAMRVADEAGPVRARGQMLFVSSPMVPSFVRGGQLANITMQNNADSHGVGRRGFVGASRAQ